MTHAVSPADAAAVASVEDPRLPLASAAAFVPIGEVAGPGAGLDGSITCGSALRASSRSRAVTPDTDSTF